MTDQPINAAYLMKWPALSEPPYRQPVYGWSDFRADVWRDLPSIAAIMIMVRFTVEGIGAVLILFLS